MLVLAAGLAMTGGPVLTPMLMAVLMITGDFLTMSASTDRVRPSNRPNAWRIGRLTLAGAALGLASFAFCTGLLAVGIHGLRLAGPPLQTFTAVVLAFASQAVFYSVRERRRIWSSRPGGWLLLSSAADVAIIGGMAWRGVLMAPLAPWIILAVAAASVVFALALDTIKAAVFAAVEL
jgi:H+-transporting ATPase